jgi:hypothetical protein
MRMLLFVPDQDTPGKKDVSKAFLPEAQAFARFHGVDPAAAIRRFPSGSALEVRRMACTLELRKVAAPLDVVGFFCHGWKAGIQAGWLREHNLLFARQLAVCTALDAYVLLYACDTGRDADLDVDDDRNPGPGGDGGFADGVRDACDVLGRHVTVMGHATTGHCSMNPHARYFAPQCGGQGGHWYVEPKSHLWPLWVAALRDPRSTLRYRFYSMSPAQIAAELVPEPGPLVA